MLQGATLSGVVSARDFAPRANFLAGGKSRRLVEIDRHYDDSAVVWQEDVYRFARLVADETGPARIVDIGTGSGVKLQSSFAGHPAATLQTDWHDDRMPLPDGAAMGSFLPVNLEEFGDLERLEAALDPREPTLFILSDVIEHLQDPRPLLRTLRRLLKLHAGNRLVISTPDRERVDGARADGLPDNRGHVRQWTLNEFGLAMMSAGFIVRRIGRLPQNAWDACARTICAELACTAEHCRRWLHDHGLPPPAAHMVLTTEHARAERTGGIGTYIQLAEEADRQPRLILFAGNMGLPEERWWEAARARGWIHVADMCGRSGLPLRDVAAVDPDDILAAAMQALFLYDEVRLIEYQDYLGIGYRVAQAKRAGLLPPSVSVVAYAHGNQLYLDAAAGEVGTDRSPSIDAWERLSLELADVALFPSRYLRDLYVEKGGFRPRAERFLPYPIRLAPNGLDDLSRGPIRTLVFYGKQTPQKGYPDFVEAVRALFADPRHAATAARLERVVLMGVTEPDARLKDLPITVEHGVWSRAEAVAMLRRFAADSLLVLPYRGDNHPLSIFEVIDADCQFIAFDIGGVPEHLPGELADMLLCAPDGTALAAAMARALSLSHWDRCRLVERTRALVREAYMQHTEEYRAVTAALTQGPAPAASAPEPGAVTVVVPNLNGRREHLADAALGLRNSFQRPRKILLVDDGSTPENFAELQAAAARFGDIPTEIIRHERNLGLAAARNLGLARTETPYLCAHDNDNIVLNRFLQIACRILDENPEVAAVTCWLRHFDDGTEWQAETWGEAYRPTGADLGEALRRNTLGDALAVYRVSALREIGGWNATSKAKWEDWECFLRLAGAGKDIWVIPQEVVLYRIRQGSMLRAYPDFPGWLRLANALPGLPRAQSVALLRGIWMKPPIIHMQDPSIIARVNELEAILRVNEMESNARLDASEREKQAILQRLQALETSTTWRVTHRLRAFFDRRPRLKRVVRAPLAVGWRGARAVRNAITGR
ncbi:glycosyltransferase [Roseomonas eburnea]|uniref:Glycosyltransferase n=1 Tax=Neoroseomonas eburnea TaxID=1346889 RepID=A0A9X9X8C2_9PROT|nr:glycosyltransferase [Neoroseomonas eburnea]MBR0679958.1 glycosyltransferase [Neoroseomonas eburnea]